MAILTNREWCNLMNRIHSGRSCLTLEAQKYGFSLDEIIAMGDKAHTGGNAEREKEWNKTKRESSKRDKQMARPRKSSKKSKAITETTTESAPAPVIDTLAIGQMMSNLEKTKEDLQCLNSDLLRAKESRRTKHKNLESAKKALSEAEDALQESEKEVEKCERKIKRTEKKIEKMETEINKKKVYLVDPLYKGELPKYGIFISTSEREGVLLQEVPTEYIPDQNVEDVFLFKEVEEYQKVIAFVGLVFMYLVEGENVEVIVEDERVDELLNKHIG